MTALVLVLVFLAVAMLILGGYTFMNRERLAEAEATRQRLQNLPAEPKGGPIMRDTRMSTLTLLDRILRAQPITSRLERELVRSGLSWTVGVFVLASAVSAMVGLLIFQTFNLWIGALGFVVFMLIPFLWMERSRVRRARKIEEQLPHALDMVVNAMRAGFSLPAAIKFVGEEMPAPIGAEFFRFSEEQRLGVDMRTALLALEDRIGTLDAKLLVTTMLVQRETGGPLGEVLTGLATVIRERQALRQHVETLTAEPHASATVLGLLPVAAFAILFFLDRPFMQPMLSTDTGHMLLLYAASSVLVGYLILNRIAKVEL